jgi:branched-chain amino acid transport system permease protein
MVILVFIFPFFADNYFLDVANQIGVAIIGAIGLNILTGFTGQISIGHAAFLAIGAYASAILTSKVGMSFWISLPLAGVVTALIGMIFGIPSLRLKGLYLAMATFAAHFITEFTINHWESLTNGTAGILVPPPAIGKFEFDTDQRMYFIIFTIAICVTFSARNLFRTKVGRAFLAIRDRDISAAVMGVNLFKYKLLAFAISSFYAGVAGALMAHHRKIITPENFPIWEAIRYLAMIIIGGLGSILGSVYGAVFMILLDEVLRTLTTILSGIFPNVFGLLASLREGVFGITIILFLIFEPDGLVARWHTIRSYWKLWPFSY